MINFDKTYDSHVHFFGVGIGAVDWIIENNNLKLPDHLKDQHTVRGFGLDSDVKETELSALYNSFPDIKFCLSYSDGHSSLVSKNLISELSFKLSPEAKVHENFVSLYEKERDEFLRQLPKRSNEELKKMALYSVEYFKKQGVKRLRHMTCTIQQWNVLAEIYKEESSYSPELYIECMFAEFMDQNFEEAIDAFNFARRNPINKVEAVGIKLFFDGSISQSTAYMSSFKNSKPRLSKIELEDRMETVLVKMKVPLALHTIGDLALETSLMTYKSLAEKHEDCAPLHLEHAPVFTKDSMQILKEKKLDCTFHFQPSHWIKDSIWYENEKHSLKPHCIYPFYELKQMGYDFFMGSDAPVEESKVDLTEKGLARIKETKG